MRFLNYQAPRQILLVTKGHPFDREQFYSVFDRFEDFETCVTEQPAAQALFAPEVARDYSAFVMYDMPGMNFMTADPVDGLAPLYVSPPQAFKDNFLALLDAGKGFVFLHHSIAAWPAWEEYSRIVGGRFLYKPDNVQGEPFKDSGYRHAVAHRVSLASEHPVTAGLEDAFTLTDELYLAHVYEDEVIPLLYSDYTFVQENFYSAQQAVQGTLHSREGWSHPPGHNLIGWVKHYRNAPIVYLQCGDSQATYDNPAFQRLLHNAINWVASDEARAWARQRHQATG